MGIEDYKITDGAIAEKGVVAAPDKLTGTAQENKALFDRLIREAVKGFYNGLIDALSAATGAGEIGVTEIQGVAGANVQAVLTAMKVLVDAKAGSADVTAALGGKTDTSVSDGHFKAVTLDANTGKFTFTRESGATVEIDTALEKVVTNWAYDQATQALVLTQGDGSVVSVSLSDFITETEFSSSDSVEFSVSGHKVTATIKAGSITDTMLSSALVAMLQGYVSSASGSATAAAQSEANALAYKQGAETAQAKAEAAQAAAETAQSAAEDAEDGAGEYAANAAASAESAGNSALAASQKAAEAAATVEQASAETLQAASASAANAAESAALSQSWAVGGTGTREGEDTNNAQYWSEQARIAAGGGVNTFNGRDGAVIPQAGDYTASDVGAIPDTEKGAAGGVAELDAEGKVPAGQLPSMDYIPTSEKGTAGGVASLDSTGKVPGGQMPAMNYVPTSGGTMTGALTLSGDPTEELQAVPRRYLTSNAMKYFDNTLLQGGADVTAEVAGALGAYMEGGVQIATGSYTGTGGTADKTITTYLKPKFGIIFLVNGTDNFADLLVFSEYMTHGLILTTSGSEYNFSRVVTTVTDSGITLTGGYSEKNMMNISGRKYAYMFIC